MSCQSQVVDLDLWLMPPYYHGCNILTARRNHREAQVHGCNTFSAHHKHRAAHWILGCTFEERTRAGRDLKRVWAQVMGSNYGCWVLGEKRFGELGGKRSWWSSQDKERVGALWVASLSKKKASSSSCQSSWSHRVRDSMEPRICLY